MKGKRTVIFNLIMGLGLIAGVETDPQLVEDTLVWLAGLWTAGNLALRAVTDSPIFKKE